MSTIGSMSSSSTSSPRRRPAGRDQRRAGPTRPQNLRCRATTVRIPSTSDGQDARSGPVGAWRAGRGGRYGARRPPHWSPGRRPARAGIPGRRRHPASDLDAGPVPLPAGPAPSVRGHDQSPEARNRWRPRRSTARSWSRRTAPSWPPSSRRWAARPRRGPRRPTSSTRSCSWPASPPAAGGRRRRGGRAAVAGAGAAAARRRRPARRSPSRRSPCPTAPPAATRSRSPSGSCAFDAGDRADAAPAAGRPTPPTRPSRARATTARPATAVAVAGAATATGTGRPQGQGQGQGGQGGQGGQRNGDQGEPGPASRPGRRPRPGRRAGQGGQGAPSRPEEFVGEPVDVEGFLDLRDEGYGFLRVHGYLPSKDDVYVSVKQVRQLSLRKGDHVKGASRPASRNEKNPALLRIDEVNGKDPEPARNRRRFEDLTPLFPDAEARDGAGRRPDEHDGPDHRPDLARSGRASAASSCRRPRPARRR